MLIDPLRRAEVSLATTRSLLRDANSLAGPVAGLALLDLITDAASLSHRLAALRSAVECEAPPMSAENPARSQISEVPHVST
jgi:hypothetical protein